MHGNKLSIEANMAHVSLIMKFNNSIKRNRIENSVSMESLYKEKYVDQNQPTRHMFRIFIKIF